MSCNEPPLDNPEDSDPASRPVRIAGIVDSGSIITVIGRNTETDRPVHIHFDHRCFASFYTDWLVRGSPLITWDASRSVVGFTDGGDDG
jgi:hypothetical protein